MKEHGKLGFFANLWCLRLQIFLGEGQSMPSVLVALKMKLLIYWISFGLGINGRQTSQDLFSKEIVNLSFISHSSLNVSFYLHLFELNVCENSKIGCVWFQRYMDTSLIDVDVQPTYVRVMVKGKVSKHGRLSLKSWASNSARLPQKLLRIIWKQETRCPTRELFFRHMIKNFLNNFS